MQGSILSQKAKVHVHNSTQLARKPLPKPKVKECMGRMQNDVQIMPLSELQSDRPAPPTLTDAGYLPCLPVALLLYRPDFCQTKEVYLVEFNLFLVNYKPFWRLHAKSL